MQNVILIVHLILAICLIAVVLLQRSEGGALGIGGGGGGGISSRPQQTALSKVTWALAIAFITTSMTLAILAGGDPAGQSVLDEVQDGEGEILLPDLPPAAGDGGDTPDITLPDLGGGADGDSGQQGGGSVPVAPPAAD